MQEIKEAFGQYMAGFYAGLVPTTKAMNEYVERGLAKSIAWAPGRMVDAAEEMLTSWRKNDNNDTPSSSAFLPVVIVAMAKDYQPVLGEYSRQLPEPEFITIPEDPKERIFQLRQIQGDRRAQIAIFAADEPTASSIARQFCLWLTKFVNRTINVKYRFAGMDHMWPTKLETPDVPAIEVKTDQKNLTILAIDITLKETIPLFKGPSNDEPNDGKGNGTPEDPHGYASVLRVTALDQIEKVWSDTTVQNDTTWQSGEPPP